MKGSGRVGAGLEEEVCPCSCLDFTLEWTSHGKVVAVVPITKGSENGDGSKAAASTGYQNPSSLPS